MRIVIWTDAFLPEIGGLEIFCLRIAEALSARGHSCLVVTNCDEGRAPRHESAGSLTILRLAFHQTMNRADLKGLRRLIDDCEAGLNEFRPEVFHLNVCSRSLMPFALLHRKSPVPMIMTLHDRHIYRQDNLLVDELFAPANSLIAVSEFIRKDVVNHIPEISHKVCTIPNCLPDPIVGSGAPPARFRFIAVGRLIWEKGFDIALHAFALVAAEFPGCDLTIVGDGNQREELRRLAANLKVAHSVSFAGLRQPDEIAQLMVESSVVLVPSRWEEPFGLVALQAAQVGRAACAANTGGLPEIVQDGTTGLLFKAGCVQSAAQKMREMIRDPVATARMGRAAFQRATDHFNFATFVSRYEAELSKAVRCGVQGAEADC